MKIAWIDIETTGLSPQQDFILEFALIITDGWLTVLEERNWVIKPDVDFAPRMNDWVRKTHTDSGLLEAVAASGVTLGQVDAEASAIILKHGGKYKPLLGGSSPHFDRGFIAQQMPAVDAQLHYRHFDTSTLERAFELWRPDLRQPRDGRSVAHRALDDIRWSINCAFYYQGVLRWLNQPESLP